MLHFFFGDTNEDVSGFGKGSLNELCSQKGNGIANRGHSEECVWSIDSWNSEPEGCQAADEAGLGTVTVKNVKWPMLQEVFPDLSYHPNVGRVNIVADVYWRSMAPKLLEIGKPFPETIVDMRGGVQQMNGMPPRSHIGRQVRNVTARTAGAGFLKNHDS
jgi:hypothetical protein